MTSHQSVLTDIFYRAFGIIIHSFARVEYGLQFTLSALTGVDAGRIGILTRELSYSAKRDTLYSWMEIASVDDAKRIPIKRFFDEVDSYNYLRNIIAHSIWTHGTRPGSIKPVTVKVRGGKGKFFGDPKDETEQDWTEEEMTNIAAKLALIHNSYISFLRASGLFATVDENMRAIMQDSDPSGGAEAK
jgi:hypothetical protein